MILNSLNSSKSLDVDDSSKSIDENDNDDNDDQWNSIDLKFYDSHYNDKSIDNDTLFIKHVDKNNYFRNIYLFVNKIKRTTKTKKKQIIRDNFLFSFHDTILK